MSAELIQRLRDEADLCRNDGAEDIGALLDEAAEAIRELAGKTKEGQEP